jgi:hypothetical protein
MKLLGLCWMNAAQNFDTISPWLGVTFLQLTFKFSANGGKKRAIMYFTNVTESQRSTKLSVL